MSQASTRKILFAALCCLVWPGARPHPQRSQPIAVAPYLDARAARLIPRLLKSGVGAKGSDWADIAASLQGLFIERGVLMDVRWGTRSRSPSNHL
jgi:hypothetical protein